MKRLVGAALCAAMMVAPAVADDVYRWVDENGIVHYSDTPVDGAEKVTVRDPQSYAALPAPADGPADAAPVVAAVEYTGIRITAPATDSVAWNTGGELPVSVAVEPALKTDQGHQIEILLNGQRAAGPGVSANFTLTGVTRGTHQVSARVVTADGQTLARSEPVTFHVRQTSIQNPQRRR